MAGFAVGDSLFGMLQGFGSMFFGEYTGTREQ